MPRTMVGMTAPEAPTEPTTSARAHSFNAAAAQYAENRPSYPPALFDTIEELAGRSLSGRRAVDVGAGTGIATALLHERGAEVLAVEPGAGMAAEFRRRNPHLPLVRGSGDALPVADAHADLVTYAQAWHWTDPARSVPEALRVLRPGGALALWWNTEATDVDWIAAPPRAPPASSVCPCTPNSTRPPTASPPPIPAADSASPAARSAGAAACRSIHTWPTSAVIPLSSSPPRPPGPPSSTPSEPT